MRSVRFPAARSCIGSPGHADLDRSTAWLARSIHSDLEAGDECLAGVADISEPRRARFRIGARAERGASLAEAPSHVSPEDAVAPPFIWLFIGARARRSTRASTPDFDALRQHAAALFTPGDDGSMKRRNPETVTGCSLDDSLGVSRVVQPSARRGRRPFEPATLGWSTG
jgi:hypothetical protein